MKPILAISMGDPAGIGAEIIVKALSRPDSYKNYRVMVVGDLAAISDAVKFTKSHLKVSCVKDSSEVTDEEGVIFLYNCGFLTENGWSYKKVSALTGEASYKYIEKAVEMVQSGQAHAIVTGPINKESIHMAGYNYAGHTEILAALTHTSSYAMMLVTPALRVAHATTHVSMREACDRITEDRVYEVIKLAHEALKMMGVKDPRIGVAGLNAHSSENGLFGNEEAHAIIPAVKKAEENGYNVTGPVPPDTVFVKAISGMFDVVVAMYHDQGHIPVKLCGFKMDPVTNQFTSVSGINITIGLPIIRTSVDHGTAYDKAGEGRANEDSMVEALDLAATMAMHKF